jgi:protein SCO1
MSRFSVSALDRYPLPLASVLAVAAAVFLITVWEPLQQRSLAEGTAGWLDASFTTSDGATSSLAASNGHVRIVTMMYAHCPGICPLNIATLGRIENQLSTSERKQLRIVALTLDPERDSAPDLGEFRRTHGIESARWTVGRPSPSSVPQLAAGVGITYRVLPDGTVDHQSVFALLDESGRIVARTSNTQNPDPQFVAALRHALQD